MSPRRVLLVDWIDAAGAEIADVESRVLALRGAAATVRAIAIVSDAHALAADAATPALEVHAAGPGLASRLRGAAAEFAPDRVVVAGTEAVASGAIAAALGRNAPVHHWPTGFAARSGWRDALRLPRRRMPGLFAADASADADDTDAILAGCASDRDRARGRLGLWDGDYVLAPTALAPGAGRDLIHAFATVVTERDGIDLVVLAESDPRLVDQASALGIGNRVHFAGVAPRDAEWAWWAHASAAVLAGEGALSGGLVLRGLASGCPILTAASSGPATRIGAWLARQGCAPSGAGEPRDLAATLEQVLERGPSVDDAVARGRAMAARFGSAALAARLAAVIPARSDSVSRREAA